ncbi:MAG: DUF1540 domain-containing protein [Aminipila sp.]
MKNKNIKCSVQECKHNDKSKGCCELSSISVGTHESHPSMCQCTDCRSFEVK